MISRDAKSNPNLEAEIIPGLSAAGFKLGESLSSEIDELFNAKVWNPSIDGQLVYGLSINKGWLKCSYPVNSGKASQIDIVEYFYGNDAVRLQFRNGTLSMITVGGSYLGALSTSIKIGVSVKKVEEIGKISYDDIEEVYFFENDEMKGIAFQLDQNDAIVGMVVHDEAIKYEE